VALYDRGVRNNPAQRGFTLIELMIVVAIIGILAAVATPAFMEYMAKAKGTEGAVQLNRLGKSAKAYYVEHGGFPIEQQEPEYPHSACAQPGRVHARGSWATGPTSVFTTLDFTIDDAFRFSYGYWHDPPPPSTNPGFHAWATADLDCANADQKLTSVVDFNTSPPGQTTYFLSGEVNPSNGQPAFEPVLKRGGG